MRSSLSFLACDIEQMPPQGAYGNEAVEAVLFHKDHLEKLWQNTWRNVSTAVAQYGAENVTFHFPMNGSDYIEDGGVRAKLVESYQRACDLGLSGVIVHSNRIRTAAEWRQFDQTAERSRVGELLSSLRDSNSTSTTWLGLENMPTVGNYGDETDPLYVSTADFEDLPNNVGVVWDVCHALCSLQYAWAHNNGALSDKLYLRPEVSDFTDIRSLGERVVHWHFASSKGLNLPESGTTCTEGMLPVEGDLSESEYKQQIQAIEVVGSDAAVNFEVQEDDYTQRQRGPAIIAWAKDAIINL